MGCVGDGGRMLAQRRPILADVDAGFRLTYVDGMWVHEIVFAFARCGCGGIWPRWCCWLSVGPTLAPLGCWWRPFCTYVGGTFVDLDCIGVCCPHVAAVLAYVVTWSRRQGPFSSVGGMLADLIRLY